MKRKTTKIGAGSQASTHTTADRVWMVYGDCGRTPPKYLHYSEKSAREEARRLAECHIGSRFFVLRAVACFHAEKPQVVAIKIVAGSAPHPTMDDDIPF